MKNEEPNMFYPTSGKEWRDWLKKNGRVQDAVWLLYYKKRSEKPSISWSDAVNEALCYGWIDSKKKSLDEERYIQYFSPRKPNSIWSKINKDKVKVLIDSGLMTDVGLETIRIAKENGSWTFLDSVEQLLIPEDLEQEFLFRKGAKEYFLGLSKSMKKQLLYWIKSAKREETRKKRIIEVVDSVKDGTVPKQFR